METTPILCQKEPKTKINYAYSLDSAGWILGKYKGQRLVSVDLWESEGRTYFNCEFETAPEQRCNYKEFIKDRKERPEELKKTVAAGLAELTRQLNQLLKQQKNIPALNTNKEATHG